MANCLQLLRGHTWLPEELPNKSIALDGAVRGPMIDTCREIYSFDHHENCIRHATRSTCEQVLDAILLGLKPDGFNVYINDVDGDTVMAYWLLNNPGRATESRVQELVLRVGQLDSHGPAYPVGESADGFHSFVMKPQVEAKRNKTYAECDLQTLLLECEQRLTEYLTTEVVNEKRPENRSFELTFNGQDFVMAKSDSFIFDLLYKEGHTRAVAYSLMKDGSIAYTVGKKSEFVSGFNIPAILAELNKLEPGWGGGSTIGGAPRNADGSRSKLSPDEVRDIILRVISQ